jgi:hypothetical protein
LGTPNSGEFGYTRKGETWKYGVKLWRENNYWQAGKGRGRKTE